MFNLNEFIITKTITSYVKDGVAGNTSIFNGYFPNLYNNVTNYVMDISGSLRISGDMNINDGGNLFCRNFIKSSNIEGIDACGNIFIGGMNTISGARNISIGNFSSNTINTRNIIKIGGTITSSISLKTGPILYLNYTSLPNSSAGPGNQASGIHIGDNGSLDAGYMVVSYDRAGYVFKSPASNNVVKLDISGLLLPSTNSKIVSLRQPSGANETIDSNYVISATSIDVSNVFLKNDSISTATQQVVDTSMSVLGTMSIGKYTTLTANAKLDVSGNAIVSRLGVGTNSVNSAYALEINGNVFQGSGGFIWQF